MSEKRLFGDQTNEELVEDIIKFLYSGELHAQLVGVQIMLTGKSYEDDSELDRQKVKKLAEWSVDLVGKGRGDRSIHTEELDEGQDEEVVET